MVVIFELGFEVVIGDDGIFIFDSVRVGSYVFCV